MSLLGVLLLPYLRWQIGDTILAVSLKLGRKMQEILTGEFFWGVVIGLMLAFVSAWAQAEIASRKQAKTAKSTVARFCTDTIKNIQSVVSEMDRTRDRSRAIHHDFLMLIEVEVQIYGRNREHLIHLPDELRGQVREFMNDIAVKRAEVANKLTDFCQMNNQASQLQVQGAGSQASRLQSDSIVPLGEAQKAADKLVTISKDCSALVDKLAAIE